MKRLTPLLAMAPLLMGASASASPLEWTSCPDDISSSFPRLGDRLQCSQTQVPLDHAGSVPGTLTLELLRVRAAHPAERRGVLMVNPGGPGLGARFFTASLPANWEDEAGGASDKHRISERHDLIAVQPRGLSSGSELRCRSSAVLKPYGRITDDRSGANLIAINENAAVIAAGCSAHPWSRFITTEQTARDMDLVRTQLGEEKINYWGVSYGTELGAWYGLLFPDHVDRMILDSNVDWTKGIQYTAIPKSDARQVIYQRFLVERAVARPEVYGLGTDAQAIDDLFADLEPVFRDTVRYSLGSIESLMAARVLQSWLRESPDMDAKALDERITSHHFSDDPDVDEAARRSAQYAAVDWFSAPESPSPLDLDPNYSVQYTVLCNSAEGIQPPSFWDDMGDRQARENPVGGSTESHQPCAYWPVAVPARPDMAGLDAVRNLMVLQMEFDAFTPRATAFNAFTSIPSASIVYAAGLKGHGMIYNGASSCVDRVTTAFMADGIRPGRLHVCEHAPTSVQPTTDKLRQIEARARQSRGLQHLPADR